MSSDRLTPDFASASMSAHLLELERPGAESHFLRRASASGLSGMRASRDSAREGEDQGSCESRMSDWKWSFSSSRERLWGVG